MKPITPTQWGHLKRYQGVLDSKECLSRRFGADGCDGRIVRAHMIPRSQLEQIAEQGHVHAVPTRLSPIAQMKRSGFAAADIGIGNFSTLKCFCARHDKTLFAPLEDASLTFTREQLTLLHYRALAGEVYMRLPHRRNRTRCEEIKVWVKRAGFGFIYTGRIVSAV
jgi:hypothetical protein